MTGNEGTGFIREKPKETLPFPDSLGIPNKHTWSISTCDDKINKNVKSPPASSYLPGQNPLGRIGENSAIYFYTEISRRNFIMHSLDQTYSFFPHLGPAGLSLLFDHDVTLLAIKVS